MLISTAYAQSAGGSGGTEAFFYQLIPIILMIGIFYLLLIRPQQQRVKAHQQLVAAVRRGDTVVTSGGIIGKVVKVLDGDEILLEIAEDVRIRVVKSTLADVRSKTEPAAPEAKAKADASDDKK
jgi:preprotein translocase subunit YajC